MNNAIRPDERIGFVKTSVDVHSLGVFVAMNLLRDCGYDVFLAPPEVCEAVTYPARLGSAATLENWIRQNRITFVGFSYRLDPNDGKNYFCAMLARLKERGLFVDDGGPVRGLSFAGLPEACRLVDRETRGGVLLFQGGEKPLDTLRRYGVPSTRFPKELVADDGYDEAREEFATRFIARGEYLKYSKIERYPEIELKPYPTYGTDRDTFVARSDFYKRIAGPPVIRAHSGPYSPNRQEALNEYYDWVKRLAASRLLDVLSIGSSQLSQSRFGENWDGLANGGGVPVNSAEEYATIRRLASPMLVRTYAGTKNVPHLAEVYEKHLNISWHALSYWWFCETDGRGPNPLRDNLKEQFETIRYVASTGKPLEPIVSHHFAFRGGDDVTYVVSAYIAAKTAKRLGIKRLVLQNMLNTPKYTWGVQDLAKGRAMLKLTRELEDADFKVYLQTRAGLDYFVPDMERAKVQLAAVTALMDDLEPTNAQSPDVIHVVSYSEAAKLATPPIIDESIQITLGALESYRAARRAGTVEDTSNSATVVERTAALLDEARDAIALLENNVPNLYTPDGLYGLFVRGFFPTPYLVDPEKKFAAATRWTTAIKNGGIRVVDEKGRIVDTRARYRAILDETR